MNSVRDRFELLVYYARNYLVRRGPIFGSGLIAGLFVVGLFTTDAEFRRLTLAIGDRVILRDGEEWAYAGVAPDGRLYLQRDDPETVVIKVDRSEIADRLPR